MKNLLVLLLLAGCDPAEVPCRCTGEVPGGRLDLDCGQVQCVNGAGYACTAANTVTGSETACQLGPADSCDIIDCSSPPANTCADRTTRRVFKKAGTCSAGKCSYPYTDTHCTYGCSGGSCLPEPCGPSNCTLWPDNCVDSMTLDHFTDAVCETDGCTLYSERVTCPNGCVDGACFAGSCPVNQTASSMVGKGVFTGSFLSANSPITSACLARSSPGFLWQAPADGVFTFSVSDSYDYTSATTGSKYTLSSAANVVVGVGSTCGGAAFPTCASAGLAKPFTLKLTAGQEVIIAASSVLVSSSSYTVTRSDYSVDITQCTPNCTGKTCGSDGCGGSCGMCGMGQMCSAAGSCVCAPNCSGKNCGDNGCGGNCGTCGNNQMCSAAGLCVCTPNCTNKTCGSDGCGGSCGMCGLNQICSANQCIACTPNCTGKTCGDNGCGGSCGSCGSGSSCTAGKCVADPDFCDPVANTGCSIGNDCLLLSTEKTACAIGGTGTQGSSCDATHTCDGGYACIPPGVCRHVCLKATGEGCTGSSVCNGVSGWLTHGACT